MTPPVAGERCEMLPFCVRGKDHKGRHSIHPTPPAPGARKEKHWSELPPETPPAAVPQVKDDGIYERIGGEFYEIGDPEDCDACAKLDDLERDVPICYLHRTPQRCGDCADHPILKCPTCDIPSAVADAVRAENEACATIAESWLGCIGADESDCPQCISQIIRARSRDGGGA